MKTAVVILAAGQGTRMRSKLSKVLHPVAGKPSIRYSLQAAREVSLQKPVVVIGHGADALRKELNDEVEYAIQEEQLGTAHAVMMAKPVLLNRADQVVVISGDMPLLTGNTLKQLAETQKSHRGHMTLLTIELEVSRGFGRILRSHAGDVLAIIEEAQATDEQLTIKELNVGAYCFDAAWLWEALERIRLSPKGEYYLTDLVEIAVSEEQTVLAVQLKDEDEAIGINNRLHLADAERAMQKRINCGWMLAGVTIIDPNNTYIGPDVSIGQDTVIYPNTFLKGKTLIGEDCRVGPNAILESTQLRNRCMVLASVLEHAVLEDGVEIGPFGHLRKGAHLAQGVHMGNFGEVKNSYLGPGTKMGHFSYIGDAQIGENVNIGAGTITCNFHGVKKNHTEIGANSFIGSDTMLVAPVKLGEGAHTGAGAVVTHDVPPHTLVVGVPARPMKKKEESG
jgi:bifunctional UDP-N-acetylglucosamine pyrophosphorylase/glucosamine-1-phosphate N-acetyltransferase